ncbi:MAG: DUF1460 domain-containing protein [Alphaproteobacteria bacterium]|nr:DUF1460 domain-containing protein [Alphaproteobacteria bacterium]
MFGILALYAWAGPGESTLPEAVREAAVDSRNLPLAERIDRVSESMLGHPYVNDPLGEGRGVDRDPPVRYDAYDCLTFVEEVLALSLGGDPDHAAEVRLALRYDEGEIDYARRNHFMELQWIPHAIARGWVRDTTADYGTPTRMERVVDEATWNAWRSRGKFALTDEELPKGQMQLDVLSLDDAIAAAGRVRPGTLLLTVRADRSWNPIWISHLGIVVPGDTPTVRHATKMGEGSTRDHGLVWYLEHLKTYDKWPAVGVAMLEPVEYGPRISRLPPELR